MKFFFFTFLLFLTTTQANIIKLVAVNNCPYACKDKDQNKGFVVDLIKEVFNKSGYKISYQSFENYELALESIKQGKNDIMIDVDPGKNRELIFMKKPLGYKHNVIITPTYSKWKYSSSQSLRLLKLAVIKEERYTDEIAEYITKNSTDETKIVLSSGRFARKSNLKYLRFEKVTALIDDKISLRYFYFKKRKPFTFKIAYTAPSKAIHVAFSAKSYRSNKYAEILYRGLKRLKNSTNMKTILQTYGLDEAYMRELVQTY